MCVCIILANYPETGHGRKEKRRRRKTSRWDIKSIMHQWMIQSVLWFFFSRKNPQTQPPSKSPTDASKAVSVAVLSLWWLFYVSHRRNVRPFPSNPIQARHHHERPFVRRFSNTKPTRPWSLSCSLESQSLVFVWWYTILLLSISSPTLLQSNHSFSWKSTPLSSRTPPYTQHTLINDDGRSVFLTHRIVHHWGWVPW